MKMLRFLMRPFLMSAVDETGGGGGVVETPAAPVVAEPAAVTPAAPATMLDAMFPAEAAPAAGEAAADAGRARDASGRFIKTEAEKAADVAAAAQPKPVEPAKPPTGEDLRKVPDGLSAGASQRFQALANANKEYEAKIDSLSRQTSYIQETFGEHGVTQPQFEQAVGFIGMVNKGDFDGAEKFLLGQLQQLSLVTGRPMPGVDALQTFPDLRAEVDAGQMSEARALEVARLRTGQQAVQSRTQAEQQQQQAAQQDRQAAETGLKAVDDFCKSMQESDLDYAAVEERLVPLMKDLLEGVPPQHWAAKVQHQYKLIKQLAGGNRPQAPSTPSNILRPTGATAPKAEPKTMFDAMWSR